MAKILPVRNKADDAEAKTWEARIPCWVRVDVPNEGKTGLGAYTLGVYTHFGAIIKHGTRLLVTFVLDGCWLCGTTEDGTYHEAPLCYCRFEDTVWRAQAEDAGPLSTNSLHYSFPNCGITVEGKDRAECGKIFTGFDDCKMTLRRLDLKDRLARILNMAPDAPEEVLLATVEKSWAGTVDRINELEQQVKNLQGMYNKACIRAQFASDAHGDLAARNERLEAECGRLALELDRSWRVGER